MTPYTDALEAFNRATHDDSVREMQIAPAEDLQADEPRLHPLVTSLWVAAGLLFAAHVVWVANGMPVL